MTLPNNALQMVQTYQKSGLAYLENLNCFISTANTKFKNFNNITANLGSSVSFDMPPRFSTSAGLVAAFQSADQRELTLTCDQAANTSYAFTSQDRMFNVDKSDPESYLPEFVKSAMKELSAAVELNLALNANSSVPVYTVSNGASVATGALHTESGPYRFFGNGVDPINSYKQLARMISNYKDFGAPTNDLTVYLPTSVVPDIIGDGLGQFAPRRNNELAMSWEIGSFGSPEVKYCESNLLPIHFAGNVGNADEVLTVASTNDATGAHITEITFSGATASDAGAIKSGDLFQFQDGVSGQVNVRLRTFVGHNVSSQPVQFCATADAASDGSGNVTISFKPALQSTAGADQNISSNIVAGMQVKALPDHACGLVVGGNSMFLAMPRLPDQRPFDTSSEYDSDTGVSMRMYYGSMFGQNQSGYINDCAWGSVVPPDYCMRIAFPI